MDDEKLAEVLKRARAALKNGRDERKEALADMRDNLAEAISNAKHWGHPVDEDDLRKTINQARSKNMLGVVKNPDWRRPAQALEVKEKEPYQKRPSVRSVTTEQTPETKLNLVGNRLNTAIDNRLRKETPEAIDMAIYGKIMPETKTMLRYEVYLNKDPMATLNGYQKGDKCQRVRVGKLVQGVSSEKHCAAIFEQYNSPRYDKPEAVAKIKRSISVGDVIKIGKEAYAVEQVGFRRLDSFRVRSRSNERGAGRSI